MWRDDSECPLTSGVALTDRTTERIAVLAWSIGSGVGGVETYLRSLLPELCSAAPTQLVIFTSQFTDQHVRSLLKDRSCSAEVVRCWLPSSGKIGRILFEQSGILKVILRRHGVSRLLVPSNVSVNAGSIAQVVVIQAPLAVKSIRSMYDLSSGTLRDCYYDIGMSLNRRRRCSIVAVSSWLAQQIVATDPTLGRHVSVIYEGAPSVSWDSAQYEPTRVGEVSSRELRLLFVSNIYPYKGLDTLLLALSHLTHENWTLKIIGEAQPDESGELEAAILSSEADARIRYMGSQPTESVLAAYREADIFIYPSRLETFGLPPLEAMAMGTPVIASDAASIPEVVGSAAQLFPSGDEEKLAKAIDRLADDTSLRMALVGRGLSRVKELTWQSAAEEMISLLTHDGQI